ncbi:MAG: type II toxin-antitoxin system ParD family antitoxin [Verrucomicrobia bacterium]|nr:type II toxin-antitoxin system ParD family antitoxin [Verrucomicrobiota bacterium]
MTINLGEHFERMVADLITCGRFQNQSEVIRAGLRLLEDGEYGYDPELEAELARRLEGRTKPLPKGFFIDIKRRGHQRLQREGLKRAA